MADPRVKRGQSIAMNRAQALIERGYTVTQAALKAGVQAQSIYRRPWYKEFIKGKQHAE